MIALMLTIELLQFSPASSRALGVLHALKQGAPHVRVESTQAYRGTSDVLMLWGPGAPDRVAPMAAHLAAGRHVLALDLAYWARDHKFRVSIDAAHPQQWVLGRDWPADRFEADAVTVADLWKPTGPVVVAGIGRKARVQYGDAVDRWEVAMMRLAAERWPGRSIVYRRKQADAPMPTGAVPASTAHIDRVLAGASLLLTWHSNVAVDAIRMGIPVICHDGAAAAVCPSSFGVEDPEPLAPAVRERFLRNLSYFQWAPREASAFWQWVPQVLA